MVKSTINVPRRHVVMVPGFGGFDALGQLDYYADVTQRFTAFCGPRDTLHYFDNLPTAAVVTRAQRLEKFLGKLVARNDVAADDEIVLVGHSTGGLDIRRMIVGLAGFPREVMVRAKSTKRAKAPDEGATIQLDGTETVGRPELLDQIKRVVFLSVPHRGTNIADWVGGHSVVRQLLVAWLRAQVEMSQLALLDRLQAAQVRAAAWLAGVDLGRAIADALAETRADTSAAERVAGAHEAAADLALYLRHIATDFRAIDDLAARVPEKRPDGEVSPAHFDAAMRRTERALYRRLGIQVRSYCTRSASPFRFETGQRVDEWTVANPFEFPEWEKDASLSEGTDFVYRAFYRACAGGPFEAPAGVKLTRAFIGSGVPRLSAWDNDGVVNTLSMLWPDGDNVLVGADHMDIVGHYKLSPEDPEEIEKLKEAEGRSYRSYDLLKSRPEFQDCDFDAVWKDLIEFACPRE